MSYIWFSSQGFFPFRLNSLTKKNEQRKTTFPDRAGDYQNYHNLSVLVEGEGSNAVWKDQFKVLKV